MKEVNKLHDEFCLYESFCEMTEGLSQSTMASHQNLSTVKLGKSNQVVDPPPPLNLGKSKLGNNLLKLTPLSFGNAHAFYGKC